MISQAKRKWQPCRSGCTAESSRLAPRSMFPGYGPETGNFFLKNSSTIAAQPSGPGDSINWCQSGVHVIVYVNRKNYEFLPVHDPVAGKIKRKIMNCGLPSTIAKFRNAAPALAVCTSLDRRGSLNSNKTAKNISNTLNAATRKTLSTRMCWCTHEAM